jgi:hypothetical protein
MACVRILLVVIVGNAFASTPLAKKESLCILNAIEYGHCKDQRAPGCNEWTDVGLDSVYTVRSG